MNEQLLKDFIATAQKYNYDWNKTFELFPELKGYDQQLLKDYVATAEQDNYDYSIVNPKFPELGFVKKKEQTAQPQPTAQAQPMAQKPQAPAAMESSLGASSLASPSAEERGLTLLTPEKSKQMAQEAVTGTYMGSQKAAPVMKVEALPVSAPSKSEADFSSSLEEVNKDLMDYDEDYIVPKLDYLFGKNKYNFEFNWYRDAKEAIEVKAPNGKKTVIPVDAWTEKGDIESAEAFKKFLNENKPKLAKLSDEYNIYQSTIKNEQDMKKATESMNAETMQLNKIQQDLVLENNNLDKELKYLQSVPQSERGSQDYINRLEQFNKQREDFSARLGNASQMEKDVTMKQNQLYTSIGRYTSMRAEQGGFFGGLYNSLLGGYSSMGAAATGIATDVIMSLPLELTSSPKDIQDTFTMVASSKGIEVPANMDYEKFKQWSQTLDEDTKSEINSQVKDYLTKRTKGEMLPSIRKGLTETIGAKGTTPEYIQDAGLIKGGIYGLAASLPAMSFAGAGPAGTMSAFFLQGYDATMKEMESEEFKDVSENEKYLVALPVGIVSAALEEFGMRNVLGKSGLVNDIVAKALSKSGAGTTATTFKQLVENEIESRVARGALVLTAAGLSEAETGATQAAVEIGIKELYNTVKGKDMFKTPETVGEFVKEVAIAGAQEAIGGVVMGSFNAVGTAYGENNFDGVTNETLDVFSKLANDDNARSAYAVDLKIKIVKGEITPEQGKKALDDLNNSISVFNSIPDGLAPAQQRQAFSLLRERKGLEAEIQGKDEAMVKKQKARIAEINSELEKVSEMKEAAPSEAPSVAPSEAKPEEIPQEIASLADDEIVVMRVKTLEEIPEEFRDRAEKMEGADAEVRNTILGFPIGKKTTQRIGDGFRYILTGKEAKDYAIQKQTAGQVPVQPTARPSEEVAQGEPQAEPQVTAQAGVEEEVSRLEEAFGGEFAETTQEVPSARVQELQEQRQLSELEDKVDRAKKNIQFAEDTQAAIEEYNKAKKEKDDFEANIEERKQREKSLRNIESLIEDEADYSNNSNYEYRELYDKDPRLAIIQRIKDMIEFSQSGDYERYLIEQGGASPEQAKKDVQRAIDRDTKDLADLEADIKARPTVSAQTQKPSGVSVSNKAQVAELETKTTDTNKKGIIKAATTAINTLKSIFPDMDIVIHESNDSYTKQVGQSTRGNFAVTRTADGKIVGGRIDINLSKANMRTVAHEVAHAVMLKAFGDNPALFKVFRDRISNILSETRIKSLNDFASQYAENDSHEEFLVELSAALTEAQEQLKPITVNKIAQLINKVVSKITGGRLQPFGEKIQTNELIDFMNTMSSAIGRGEAIQVKEGATKGAAGVVSKAQVADEVKKMGETFTVSKAQVDAYHGSPYDFDRFTTEKIGTGEGVQAFGWGLYFTDLKSIAETYADKLSKPNFNKFREKLIKDKLQDNVINDILDFSEYHDYDYDKVLSALIKNENTKAVDYLKDNKDLFDVSNKKVYQVSLHQGKTPDQYTWLEWDKPVSKNLFDKIAKQLEIDDKTRKKGERIGTFNEFSARWKDSENRYTAYKDYKNGEVYEQLAKVFGAKDASLLLLRAGIDGVKYPAESIARGATSDTARGFNYVVFDENAVTIVSKAQKADEEVRKVVKDARAQGYSEAGIKAFLLKKGFTAQEADTLMSKPEAGKKIELGEELMEGYDKMMAEVDAIIERGLNRNAKQETILANVLKSVENSDAYKNGTDIQREQIVRDVKQAFGEKMKTAPSVGKILGTIKDVKKVTMTEMSLLKKQLTDVAKGAKDLMKVWTKANKKLTAELKDMVRSGSINTKQLVAVLRKFQNTNLLNQDSIDSFINYMARVFADANYAERISNIRKNLKAAKRNIQTKIGVAESVQPLLQQMLSINPTLIPESVFDKYEALVEMLGQRKAVLELRDIEDVRADVTAVMDAVTAELSKVPDLAERFESYADKVVDEEGKVQYSETVDKMLEEDVIDASEAVLMRKYRSKIMPAAPKAKMTEAEIAQEKQDLIAAIKATKIEPSKLALRDERDSAFDLSDMIDDNVLKAMDNKELKTLLAVIGNINNGYMPHQAQLMKEVISSIKDSVPLDNSVVNAKPLSVSKVYAKIKSIFTRKDSLLEMKRRNPLFFIDQVFGDFKTKNIFKSVFEKASQADSSYKAAMTRIQNRLGEAYTAVSKSFGNDPANVNRSSYRMMAYMLQLEHQTNPAGVQTKHSAMDYLKKTIDSIRQGKTSFSEVDAEMLQDILDEMNNLKDTDGNVDLDAFYSTFNKAEKNAIKVIQEVNLETRDKALYTSAVIRGDKIAPLNNYVHHNTISDNLADENISGVTTASDFNSSMQPSTKGKSLIKRSGALLALDFDVFASAQRGANFVMMDYYLTEPIRTARKTINRTRKNLEKKYDGKIPEKETMVLNGIENAFEETTSNLLMKNIISNSFMEDAVQEIAKQGYRAVLASAPRWVGELVSNMGFAMLMDRKALKTAYGISGVIMSSDAPNIMMNLKSKQTARMFSSEALSGRFVDTNILNQTSGKRTKKSKNGVANKVQQIYNNSIKKYKNSVEFIADTLITTPDKMMMRPVWFGAFANEFKRITGNMPDFDMIAENNEAYMNENKKALKAATEIADTKSTFAGATDNAYMGILKGTVKPNQSALTRGFNMFNNYMTKFLIFEYTTARTAINAAMGNGHLTRKEGAALLAAVSTRMVAYTFITGLLSSALAGLFGDEDEEDEKSLMQKIGQAMASGASGLLIGRDFGNATKTILNYGVERINENYLDALREGDYDPYKDAIAFSAMPPEKKGQQTDLYDYIKNMAGPFGPILKTADLAVKKITEEPKKEAAAIERAEKEVRLRLPLEILGNLGFIPLYKDVRKIVLKQIYKDLQKAKGESKKQDDYENPYGMSKTDMKKYFPEMYNEYYGPNNPNYEIQQIEAEINREMRKIEKEMKEGYYGSMKND